MCAGGGGGGGGGGSYLLDLGVFGPSFAHTKLFGLGGSDSLGRGYLLGCLRRCLRRCL